ncbi:MAG: SUMF1/EgtB/PvdO family nonheme iron enzyme, partial [Verrucomicrobiota bacterium]
MKHPFFSSLGLAILVGLSLVTPASASLSIDTFGTGENAFTMNFVDIGNPGNANDTSPAGYGGVANAFRMSSYEVSVDMVSKANTAGSLGITYTSRTADMPATSVSWNEAARFVNWLNASSGSVAAYKFTTSGVNDNIALWTSGDAGYNAANPFRNSNAKYFLPSENEWYKAAYYDPNKTGGAGYWDYATGSDSAPTAVASGTASGTAVYNGQSSPADITLAGGLSPYGTMGQGGNVWEWMETEYDGVNDSSGSSRGLRGGSWDSVDYYLASSFRSDSDPSDEGNLVGFRVASSELAAVPEP